MLCFLLFWPPTFENFSEKSFYSSANWVLFLLLLLRNNIIWSFFILVGRSAVYSCSCSGNYFPKSISHNCGRFLLCVVLNYSLQWKEAMSQCLPPNFLFAFQNWKSRLFQSSQYNKRNELMVRTFDKTMLSLTRQGARTKPVLATRKVIISVK